MKHRFKKLVSLAIPLLLIGHVLLFYALPIDIFALVFITFITLFLFIEWQSAILVSISFAIATLIFTVILHVSGLNKSIYYRPHEMFSHIDSDMRNGKYEENVDFEMTMPHGDLKALSLHPKVLPEPRKVTFRTDSLGFRNSHDYHGQDYLLIGDSFIVGNGTTQDDIITEQLSKKYGIDTYNLAYSGEIKAYANHLHSMESLLNSKVKVILFLFEGNDFPLGHKYTSTASGKEPTLLNIVVGKLKRYYKIFNKTDIYAFMYISTRRIFSGEKTKEAEPVEVRTVGDIPVAFYKDYIAVAERESLPEIPEIGENILSLKDSIAHIFFIPTKYRVYCKHIADCNHKEKGARLPNKQWELIQRIAREFDIPATDLTPALIEASDSLLEDGTLTYWRDDTHWNRHGISVAVDAIKRDVFLCERSGRCGSGIQAAH